MAGMPRSRATSTVRSWLASSTRITSSTTSRGISSQVLSSVRSALYAGRTTTTLCLSLNPLPPGQHAILARHGTYPLASRRRRGFSGDDSIRPDGTAHLTERRILRLLSCGPAGAGGGSDGKGVDRKGGGPQPLHDRPGGRGSLAPRAQELRA